ncbi:ATP-grasp domain-containing protein [Microbulbifer sp. CNSA002]|uniref:ATP-grasp domain-containing protein n=1 Tax=Microbulbifer sp. CNSA002 TaxID=3373604 RepID=UPI0039B5FFCA
MQGFKSDLEGILKENCIDILVPTCEEVFYISMIKEALEGYSKVFCPDFDKIKILHSKVDIYSCTENVGFLNPNMEVLELKDLLLIESFSGKVVKREFCRFGSDVLIEPDRKTVRKHYQSDGVGRFILQDKIEGIEYCCYAISNNGVVSYIAVYEPIYRVRKAAGIYFLPVKDGLIEKLIIDFCTTNSITGQISFDIMKNADGVYLIECNPRATSGLHLLSECDLSKGFLNECRFDEEYDQKLKPKMIAIAMVMIALPDSISNARYRDWKEKFISAEDVISLKGDRMLLLYCFLSILEIILISIKTSESIRAASTSDIEWDGEVVDGWQ